MNTVVALRSRTVDEAIKFIHVKFAEAVTAKSKSESARLIAGQELLALRRRIEAGERGYEDWQEDWWGFYAEHFKRSRRDANRVMKLAGSDDPFAAAEAEREANKKAVAKHRTGKKSETYVSRTIPASELDEDLVDYVYRLVDLMTDRQLTRFYKLMKEREAA